MPIGIDTDQRAGRDTLPDLEARFEQRLGRRRCRHFLPDGAIQQARSFTQLQRGDQSGEFTGRQGEGVFLDGSPGSFKWLPGLFPSQ